jgi:hypothetical protein
LEEFDGGVREIILKWGWMGRRNCKRVRRVGRADKIREHGRGLLEVDVVLIYLGKFLR